MVTYEELLTRVSTVANTLNGGAFHPTDVQGMRAVVACYDHLIETAKMIQEAINEQAIKSEE